MGLARPRLAFDGVLQRYKLEQSEPRYLDYTAEIEESKPWMYFGGPRVLLRQVLSRKLRLQATYAEEPFLTNQSFQSILPLDATDWRWLLAILNSKLMSWFFVTFNAAARRDDFPKIIIKQTRELPVPEPRDSVAIARKVESMLSLQKRLSAEQLPHRCDQLLREIDATDRQIDQLVYQLYGLSEEEIAIVEAATA